MTSLGALEITGLNALLSRLDSFDQILKHGIDDAMTQSAVTIEQDATRRAPKDENKLGGSISADTSTPFKKVVYVGAKYAPFQEFGTGKKVSVPNGLESYAAGFKKAMDGAKWADFVKSIEGWMKRHGIQAATKIAQVKSGKRKGQFRAVGGKAQKDANHSLAIAIAKKILKDGLKPQPFLFPAFYAEGPKLLERLIRLLASP